MSHGISLGPAALIRLWETSSSIFLSLQREPFSLLNGRKVLLGPVIDSPVSIAESVKILFFFILFPFVTKKETKLLSPIPD